MLDLRAVFRADRSPYLYQPDDSHWNARATDLAARALSERLGDGARLAGRKP